MQGGGNIVGSGLTLQLFGQRLPLSGGGLQTDVAIRHQALSVHQDAYTFLDRMGIFHTLRKISVLVHEHLGEVEEHVGRDHPILDGNGIYNLPHLGVGGKDKAFAVLDLSLPEEVAQVGQALFAITVLSDA